jgi:hypothetical protein
VAGTLSPYHATVSGDGIHHVTCTATDVAGNATSASARLKLDTTAPSIAVTHRQALSGYTVKVTASDSTSRLAAAPRCTDRGTALRLTAAGSSWTAHVKAGAHSLACSVRDVAGRRSTARDSLTG